MSSEETEITLKIKVNYGWDEKITNDEDAFYDAIGLAINPDFENVVKGTYLNMVTVLDEKDNIITDF